MNNYRMFYKFGLIKNSILN